MYFYALWRNEKTLKILRFSGFFPIQGIEFVEMQGIEPWSKQGI